jgi:hypothetical protein
VVLLHLFADSLCPVGALEPKAQPRPDVTLEAICGGCAGRQPRTPVGLKDTKTGSLGHHILLFTAQRRGTPGLGLRGAATEGSV